jgi:hypothetical protein
MEKQMVDRLEHCPCCGSVTHPHFDSKLFGDKLLWKVACGNPDKLCSMQTGYYIDTESCATVWNTRAAPPQQDDSVLVEEFAEALDEALLTSALYWKPKARALLAKYGAQAKRGA